MDFNLQGINIAVLGGDKREVELIKHLIKLGAKVKVIGNPSPEENLPLEIVGSLREVFVNVQAVIAPMTGTDDNGKIKSTFTEQPLTLSKECISQIPPRTPFLIGIAKDYLKELAKQHRIQLFEINSMNEFAILNAVPTAEGAIQIAMEQLPITIHGAKSLLLGLGRVGMTLARMLDGIGAKVTVVSRSLEELARAKEMGLDTILLDYLEQEIQSYQIIFNTIPALVLTKEVLRKVNCEALIIDVASSPGGTDFAAAKELGLQAILALGLPGKVAPKTAGQILGEVIPKIIKSNLKSKS